VESRQTLLEQAQKARDVDDHARALSLAARAGQIRMTPSVRLFIAEEQSALGQLANSMNNAELCANEAAEEKALKNREKILRACRSLISTLQKTGARLIVSMPKPVPPQAEVLVNGHVLPETLYGSPYFLNPGNIRVEAKAPGYTPFEQQLAAEAGQEATVTVLLPQESPPAQAIETPPPAKRDIAFVSAEPEKRPTPVGPYIVLGAGAASLGASGLFLILRNNAIKDLEALCSGPNKTICPDTADARSLKNKASTNNMLTNIAMGVGGAALVGGAIWLVFDKMHSPGTSPRAELQITPIQGGAVIGIAGGL
jgi:hypothetical protein